MAYTMGTCNYCGERHYNFRPCKARDEANAAAEAIAPKPPELHISWQPSPGLVPFGDRLANYENRGGNLHLLPVRKPDGEEAA
jgi:hypothetical protein